MTDNERNLLILIANLAANETCDRDYANRIYALVYDVERDAENKRLSNSFTLED